MADIILTPKHKQLVEESLYAMIEEDLEKIFTKLSSNNEDEMVGFIINLSSKAQKEDHRSALTLSLAVNMLNELKIVEDKIKGLSNE